MVTTVGNTLCNSNLLKCSHKKKRKKKEKIKELDM